MKTIKGFASVTKSRGKTSADFWGKTFLSPNQIFKKTGKKNVPNPVLIKLNQIGTVWEKRCNH
ncbi:MAG: hypothetical protein CM15mP88_3200 [Pseudomonadota bacterium]|nr:MAG: hypothetical protein CM15mP88_3200 [Pseudomonadota bacterium]